MTKDLTFTPANTGDFIKDMNTDNAEIDRINDLARKRNQLVGRIIEHPYADGAAVYQIIGETTASVKIKNLPVGDAWVLPAWGESATIKKSVISRFV